MDRSAARILREVFERRMLSVWLKQLAFHSAVHDVQRLSDLVIHSAVHGVRIRSLVFRFGMFEQELKSR